MSLSFDVGIFGGDKRQVYMAESFLLQGYTVAVYNLADTVSNKNCFQAHSLSELFDHSSVMIGPIPMSKDQVSIVAKNAAPDLTIAHVAYLLSPRHVLIAGNIPSPIMELCNTKKLRTFDLMADEKITVLNAIATAEGTIMEAIASSNINLHGSNCLVLGFGRCAKVLAQKLKGMDARVTVAARSKEALANATASGFRSIHLSNMKSILPSCHFIFNTIPVMLLDRECLTYVSSDVTIIDIASAPGGVDFAFAQDLHLNAKLCLGLPGKVAPKTSADILVNEIIAFMKERSD
jgi:dipicolinate synthase subunit A